ncbi:coatomer subunit delta [Entomophthora muscae]|uniref:Coatomer subunit delta n=1 Tax=Entomophthora muscae TaxID=34485 RepID=A0ACC2TTU2_9FUNG|nr:coatomer subunit delta [Entomophthora muscae]
MVVLAASICTVSGKVLLSRQFVEVPRSRIEGLLAAFPKLIGAGSQHTVVETESIRYVYQSIGNLFLVLLSNRQSNILQDIETLRLLGQVVSKVCHSTEEEKILASAFELLSAFDEIVSLGYRDTVTLSQLSTIIEMEIS